MKLLKSIFKILTFFIALSSFSQEKVKNMYIDEDFIEIDSIQYSNKCKLHIYKCYGYRKDTIKINKVLYKYAFGQLSETELEQIKLVLKRDSNIIIEPNNSIIIKYIDSLFSFNTIRKKLESHSKKLKKKYKHYKYKPFTKKRYQSYLEKGTKHKNKCVNKYRNKYPVDILYMYRYAENSLKEYNYHNFIKDENLLKHRFFKIIYNYQLLIIKPNGNYFLSGGRLSNKYVNRLLSKDDWKPFIKDLNISKQLHPKYGYGIFKRLDPTINKKTCF